MLRNRSVQVGLIVLAVVVACAAVFWQSYNVGHATKKAWVVSQEVVTGAVIGDSVKLSDVGSAGDDFKVYTGDPRKLRASHRLAVGHVIADDDLLANDPSLVAVSFKYAPVLKAGDSVDIYGISSSDNRLRSLGKNMTIAYIGGTGGTVTLQVPPTNEGAWIAVQAGNASLFAAGSHGLNVPDLSGLTFDQAVAALTGGQSGPIQTNPSPGPSPSPSTQPLPSPSASPKR